MKKKLFSILIAILMASLCMALLASCSSQDVAKGIEIIEDETTEATSRGLGSALNSILATVLNERTDREDVMLLTRRRLEYLANVAEAELRANHINEKQYIELKNGFNNNKKKYADALYAFVQGEITENTKDFIRFCINAVGKDMFCDALYAMASANFEFTYNNYVEGEYTKSVIDGALKDWEDFKTIQKTDFRAVISFGLVALDLKAGFDKKEEEGENSSFTLTDNEITSIIKKADFENSVTTAGWEVVIKTLGDLLTDDSFLGENYNVMMDNVKKGHNDLEEIAERISSIFDLAISIQSQLKGEDIAMAKGEDRLPFIYAQFQKLSEEEWSKLEYILTPQIYNSYLSVGYSWFTDFSSYSTTVTKYTVQDLKNASQDDFSQVFEGVIANISTTFSYYGWHYDRG